MKKTALLTTLLSLAGALASQAANIAWISFHNTDGSPSTAAAGVGFTQAPDIGYTNLLTGAGNTVTRFVTSATPNAAVLNTFDLVIVSRSVPSGNYQNAGATAWNSITAPMIVMSGYLERNSRLGLTTGAVIPDTTGSITLTANQSGHPVFAGISLTGGAMTNAFSSTASFNSALQLGTSVNTDALAGGGQLIASLPSLGGTAALIAEWNAGAVLANGTADTLAGHRMVFLSGSRENGITSEASGIFDLSSDGSQMFLNAVNYMAVPEPGVFSLALIGAAGLLRRRR